MPRQEINTMKETDIRKLNPDDLVDIKDISIDESLPKKERIINYLKQIKNPYCFKSNGTIVKLGFSKDGISFEEGMIQYLTHKMGSTKC